MSDSKKHGKADVHPVSRLLGEHYDKTFDRHGANSQGVDWGEDERRLELRYQKMLALIKARPGDQEVEVAAGIPSLLDVGCGYGGLLEYATQQNIAIKYTGVDMSAKMIAWANSQHGGKGHFFSGDILNFDDSIKFDYLVANGILTQKLDTPVAEMDEFAKQIIRKMFDLCDCGVAFNVMTSKVNYCVDNLYYKNPAELLEWCMNEITPHFILDHAYPLYEYTLYLYREAS